MSANAKRFAERVLEAFAEAGRATDADVIRAGGPSTSTMTTIRRVATGKQDMSEPREPTWSKIDKAANWVSGSARKVWRGLEPVGLVGPTQQDAGYVASPGERVEAGATNDEVLREIRAMRREQQELSERVARLEQRGPEPLGGTSGPV